jgi:hypothetical protein
MWSWFLLGVIVIFAVELNYNDSRKTLLICLNVIVFVMMRTQWLKV